MIELESFTEIEQKELINKKVRYEITDCGETSEAFHAVERFCVTFYPRLNKGECFECAEPLKIKEISPNIQAKNAAEMKALLSEEATNSRKISRTFATSSAGPGANITRSV